MHDEVMLRSAEHVIARLVGDEMVLLDYEGEVYYGLDPIGSRIWELLTAGTTFGAIVETLLAEYDVTREELAADVEKLLADLERSGLVKIVTDHVR